MIIIPPDLPKVNWIIETIRDGVKIYDYEEYRTLQIESTEI